MKNLLQPMEAESIRAAVAEAEARSAGEIVPVLLSAADSYEVGYWKAAALGALAAQLLALVWARGSAVWGSPLPWVIISGLAGGLASALAVLLVPRLRPWLAGREKVAERTAQRAREAFLAYELFKTRDRSGILICVFRLERRVEVLADEGIHRVAPTGTWASLAVATASTMRGDGTAAALLAAVRRCGEILAESGLGRRADDSNELSDDVRGEFR